MLTYQNLLQVAVELRKFLSGDAVKGQQDLRMQKITVDDRLSKERIHIKNSTATTHLLRPLRARSVVMDRHQRATDACTPCTTFSPTGTGVATGVARSGAHIYRDAALADHQHQVYI